jgi:hypothetical protein
MHIEPGLGSITIVLLGQENIAGMLNGSLPTMRTLVHNKDILLP